MDRLVLGCVWVGRGEGMTICWVGMGERGPDGFSEESHTERSKCGEWVLGSSLMFSVPLSYLIPSLQVALLACALFSSQISPNTTDTSNMSHCFAFTSFSNSWHMLSDNVENSGATTHVQGHMCLLRYSSHWEFHNSRLELHQNGDLDRERMCQLIFFFRSHFTMDTCYHSSFTETQGL